MHPSLFYTKNWHADLEFACKFYFLVYFLDDQTTVLVLVPRADTVTTSKLLQVHVPRGSHETVTFACSASIEENTECLCGFFLPSHKSQQQVSSAGLRSFLCPEACHYFSSFFSSGSSLRLSGPIWRGPTPCYLQQKYLDLLKECCRGHFTQYFFGKSNWIRHA